MGVVVVGTYDEVIEVVSGIEEVFFSEFFFFLLFRLFFLVRQGAVFFS